MKIFLSAVSGQFKACRDALRSDLRAVGAEVVVQEDFQQHGATLLEKLEGYIASCDRIIAIVGDAYGFEPEETLRPATQPRRSYSQWEYFFAMGERLDGSRQPPKDIFLYFASPEFLATHVVSQADDMAQLQLKFINKLNRSGKDWNRFGLLDELRALVLRDGFRLQMRAPQPRNLPYTSLGRLFKGREHILPQLRVRLQQNPGRALVIYGPAGVGKTRLTIEYALRHEAEYTALLVIAASSREALQRELAGLCGLQVLNLPERKEKEQEIQVAAALRWLSGHSGWLLILDNADSREAAEAVEALLAGLQGGHVLVTSRLSDWSGSVELFELELLSEEVAVEFLLERTKNRRVANASDGNKVHELAKELDGLALGLEQAGAFIWQMRCSFGDYLERRHAREKKVLIWHDAGLMHYPLSIAVTWDTSFEQLDGAARDLLNLLCWLAPESVPRALTAHLKLQGRKQNAADDTPAEDVDLEDALAALAGFSMLKWETGNQAFRMHRLVQEVSRNRLPDKRRDAILQDVLWMVSSYLPNNPPPNDVRSWSIWEMMVSHVKELILEAEKARIGQPTSRLAAMLGMFFAEKSLWSEAESLERLALEIDNQLLGPEDPQVAANLNNLAELYRAQGQYEKAEPLYHWALEIGEKALGSEHPNVADSLNNLALLYYTQGQYAKAESLYERALAIREKALSPEHPAVAASLNSLAVLYVTQGQYAKAEPLYERALAIREKALGSEHPNVATILNNLAELYHAQGQYAKAEPLFQRALAIFEKALGSEHPNVAQSLNSLAAFYRGQGQYAKAEPLFQRALAIREKALGSEHPDVAQSLNSLAAFYHGQGQYAKAEPLFQRALAIREKALGPEHPEVAQSLNNLAELYRAQGQYAKSEPLYQRALEIGEKALGPEHPNLANGLNNLALLYYTQGQYAKAEPLYERVLAIKEKALGPEHSSVVTSLENYALCLRAMDRPKEAATLESRARAIRAKGA